MSHPRPTAAPSEPSPSAVPDAREALHHARAVHRRQRNRHRPGRRHRQPLRRRLRSPPSPSGWPKRLVRYPPEIWPHNDLDADGNLPIAMVNLIAGRPYRPRTASEPLHRRQHRRRPPPAPGGLPRTRQDDRRSGPGSPGPAAAPGNHLHPAGFRCSRSTSGRNPADQWPKFNCERLIGEMAVR